MPYALFQGGAIYADASSLSPTQVSFQSNSATVRPFGVWSVLWGQNKFYDMTTTTCSARGDRGGGELLYARDICMVLWLVPLI